MTEQSPDAVDLVFDGERFVPGAGVEIAYQHWLRYRLALRMAAGKRVLDVASGEGYGAAMLATTASRVTGFDANARSVRHARSAYRDRENLTFRCVELADFFGSAEPASYDLATAFEFIEHVAEPGQRELLAGLRRVLAPGGLAFVSTPDKRLYTDAKLGRNPFHVREMYRGEFEGLLREYFPHVAMLEQVACTGAAIFSPGARRGELTRAAWADLLKLLGSCEPGLEGQGEYLVAVVSDAPIPEEATGAVVLVDPARKLVGEELYASHLALEAERAKVAALQRGEERAAALERENEQLRRRADALEEVAERLALSGARTQEDLARLQRVEAELELANDALAHLRRMLGVRATLRVRSLLDAHPGLKSAVAAVRRRIG